MLAGGRSCVGPSGYGGGSRHGACSNNQCRLRQGTKSAGQLGHCGRRRNARTVIDFRLRGRSMRCWSGRPLLTIVFDPPLQSSPQLTTVRPIRNSKRNTTDGLPELTRHVAARGTHTSGAGALGGHGVGPVWCAPTSRCSGAYRVDRHGEPPELAAGVGL